MVSDPSSVTVGIDAAVVAKHRVVVRGSGGVEDRFSVPPTLAGLETLTERLSGYRGALTVAEPTAMSWLALGHAVNTPGAGSLWLRLATPPSCGGRSRVATRPTTSTLRCWPLPSTCSICRLGSCQAQGRLLYGGSERFLVKLHDLGQPLGQRWGNIRHRKPLIRRLLTRPEPTPDLDASIRALLAEVDRRDGPGAGRTTEPPLATRISPLGRPARSVSDRDRRSPRGRPCWRR